MKHQKVWYWLLGVVIIIILASPLLYWSTGVGQSAAELSTEISRQPDGTLVSSPKAKALDSLTLPMRLERMLIYPLLLLAFQFSGGAVALRQFFETPVQSRLSKKTFRSVSLLYPVRRWFLSAWRQQRTGRQLLIILLFILTFNLGVFLLYLPFNFYRGFILAHQFGLSTQTWPDWLSDWGKSVLISLATDGLLWTGFYALIILFPRRWPLPAGALLMLFSTIWVLLTPILITPLFYQVQPLEDAELRKHILALARRAEMPVNEVYIIDASTKTTQVNAYVTGFGNARRIVLYDTLIAGYTPDQVEVVLAHELGHWYYRHVFLSVLGMGAIGWLGLFGLRWLLNRTWRWLGLRGPADVAGLPFIIAIITVATFLSLPLQNGISRYGERQADTFALTVSQKPEVFIDLFKQFAEQNLAIVNPSAWEEFIFYTHPPTAKRIQRAEAFLQRQTVSN